jgi:hypothetical protein
MSLATSSTVLSPHSSSIFCKDGNENGSSSAPSATNGIGSCPNGQKRQRNKPTLNCGACVDRKVSGLAADISPSAESILDRQNVTGRSQNVAPVSDAALGVSIRKAWDRPEKAQSHSGADQRQLFMVSRYVGTIREGRTLPACPSRKQCVELLLGLLFHSNAHIDS